MKSLYNYFTTLMKSSMFIWFEVFDGFFTSKIRSRSRRAMTRYYSAAMRRGYFLPIAQTGSEFDPLTVLIEQDLQKCGPPGTMLALPIRNKDCISLLVIGNQAYGNFLVMQYPTPNGLEYLFHHSNELADVLNLGYVNRWSTLHTPTVARVQEFFEKSATTQG